MTGQGVARREYVTAHVQERVCECPTPQTFEDDFGVCVKCGHQAEPEPPAAPAWARDSVAPPVP